MAETCAERKRDEKMIAEELPFFMIAVIIIAILLLVDLALDLIRFFIRLILGKNK